MPANVLEFLRRKKKWVRAACAAAWVCAFTASHIPGPKMPELNVGDKDLHLVGFLGLAGLFWATLAGFGCRRWPRVALVLTVLPAYAAFDELTQPYFQRTADVKDWAFDVLGTVCALALAEVVLWVASRRSAGSREGSAGAGPQDRPARSPSGRR